MLCADLESSRVGRVQPELSAWVHPPPPGGNIQPRAANVVSSDGDEVTVEFWDGQESATVDRRTLRLMR